MTKVSLTKNPTYTQNEINQAVQTHFERFEMENKILPDMNVVLKPNLLMKRRPEEFTTTHPNVVKAVILYLKKIGVSNITLADSPGGLYTEQALKSIYSTCGMTEVCEKHNVKLNFDVTAKEIYNPNANLVKSFTLIKPICEADFIIDLCKLKTHAMTGMSGAVKNLFGAIPGLTKPEFHWRFPEKERFCEMLIDLCDTVRPNFIVVDAIEAMEGDGPSGGTKREAGFLFASDQPYDLDFFLCTLIGAKPTEIFTVKNSIERGLCGADMSKIELIGGEMPNIKPFEMPQDKGVDFMGHTPKLLRKPAKFITKTFLTSKPKIHKRDCIGCGKCAESCPAKTIKIHEKKAYIEYSNCIKCFCCHEMCPVKAIGIKRFGLFIARK